MANTIQTISANQVIEMSTARFARLAAADIFESGWTKIRVGILASITDVGASFGSTQFFLGVCSGTTNIFGDATTTHAFGIGTSTAQTFSRTAGPPTAFSTSAYTSKRVGATLTQSSALTGTPYYLATNVGCHFVTITKGSPNYTAEYFWPSAATATATEANFDLQMLNYTPTLTSHASTSKVLACDEAADGYFDSVNVSWNITTTLFYVHKIGVIRIS